MSSADEARFHLDPDDVEAIAARVVELLDSQPWRRRARRLATADEVAEALGVTRAWVYANQRRLEVIRLGAGPKARLRFDLELAARAFQAAAEPSQGAARPARTAPSLPHGVELIRGRSSRNGR